jgi:type III pantothenate kinase
MILCDIGNTTFHFLDGRKSIKIPLEDKLPDFDKKIYFISVNKKASKKLKSKYKNAINLKNHIDFKTSYQGMGIDRMVACMSLENGIVVDAGSAITVDVMKAGKHMGGFILPGLNSYKKIYPRISKKLKFEFDSHTKLNHLPQSTNEAINYAILSSIITPIKEVSKDKHIIFTGGDGKLLKQFFKNSTYKRNLLFNSMKKIIQKI